MTAVMSVCRLNPKSAVYCCYGYVTSSDKAISFRASLQQPKILTFWVLKLKFAPSYLSISNDAPLN